MNPGSVCTRCFDFGHARLPQRVQPHDLRTTTPQNCEAAPRRARIQGSQTFASLNSRLERNKEEDVVQPHSGLCKEWNNLFVLLCANFSVQSHLTDQNLNQIMNCNFLRSPVHGWCLHSCRVEG